MRTQVKVGESELAVGESELALSILSRVTLQYHENIHKLSHEIKRKVLEWRNSTPTSTDPTSTDPTSCTVNMILDELIQCEKELKSVLLYSIQSQSIHHHLTLFLVEKHQKVMCRIHKLEELLIEKTKQKSGQVQELHRNITELDLLLQASKSLLFTTGNSSTGQNSTQNSTGQNSTQNSTGQNSTQNTTCSIDGAELLDYSFRVAKRTLSTFEPPIPQESEMRMSRLFDVNVGRHWLGLDETNGPNGDIGTAKQVELEVVMQLDQVESGQVLAETREELLDLF